MKISRTRYIACVAILSAVSTLLMYLEFAIPAIIPNFVKMDFSELPALIASFALGPCAGVIICLVKNLFHLIGTTTGGVGELANFLIGAVFVFTAGIIYKYKKTRLGAVIGVVAGAIVMGLLSFPINVFITYPVYYNFMPKDVIISMYQVLLPSVDSIEKCLIIFNAPFTSLKGFLNAILTFFIYKPLSFIIKGYRKEKPIIEENQNIVDNKTED